MLLLDCMHSTNSNVSAASSKERLKEQSVLSEVFLEGHGKRPLYFFLLLSGKLLFS